MVVARRILARGFERIAAALFEPLINVVMIKLLTPQHAGKSLPHDAGFIAAEGRRRDRLVEFIGLVTALLQGVVELIAERATGASVSGECKVVRLRLSDVAPAVYARSNGEAGSPFGTHFEEVLQARRQEADEFYAAVIPRSLNADAANVMRQALAGMLWSKQFYHYDVDKWLEERGSDPFKETRKQSPRNDHWHHMYNGDVISMPDKWEYPWYAAWDLAFHVLALTLVDPDFGKRSEERRVGKEC